MMKILMIGGTGTISSAITRLLAESEHELLQVSDRLWLTSRTSNWWQRNWAT